MKKNMIILGFLAVMMHWAVGVVGQGWERTYRNEFVGKSATAIKSIELDNGDFLTLVNSSSLDLSPLGMHLLRLKPNGELIWKRTYDFGTVEAGADIIKTSDGGYMILIVQAPNGSLGDWTDIGSPSLLKLNALFEEVFHTSPTIPDVQDWNSVPYQIFETNLGYLVSGGIFPLGLTNGVQSFFASYDLQGNLIEHTPIDNIFNYYQNALLSNDSTLIVASLKPSVPYGWIITKMNTYNHAQVWQKEYFYQPSNNNDLKIYEASGGGFLMVGNNGTSFPYLQKIDENGNEVWGKVLDSTYIKNWEAVSILPTNNGYNILGVAPSWESDCIIVSVDLLGNHTATNRYGMLGTSNIGHHLLPLEDGGMLISGSVEGLAGDFVDIPQLIRIDSNGNTFTSSISGTLLADHQGDCIADTLSSAPTYIQAYKSGELQAQAYPDTLGNWTMKVDTGNIVIVPKYAGGATVFCPDTITQVVTPLDSLSGINFTSYYHPLPMDSVFGYVFEDLDGDCVQDAFEQGYAGWTIKLSYWNMFSYNPTTTTDANGRFVFLAPINLHNGMTLTVFPTGEPVDGLNCRVTCSDNQHPITAGATSYQANFGVHCDSLPHCPGMEVSIATDRIRPCDTSHYVVSYCNRGAVEAENAYITVQFDTLISVVSSILPFTTLPDNTYRFELGTIGIEACGSFSIDAALACDPLLTGLTFCATAHAYPDTICTIPAAAWDGAQIKVEGTCEQDSVVFDIQNIGDNNMLQSLDYIVIEDNVLRQSGTFQLPAGDTKRVAIEADGHFYRIVAGQSTGFNNQNQPLAWVEACDANNSGNPSLGFVNQYTLGDEEPWLDVFCLPAVNSYDPNDKTGFPQGVYAAHQIDQNVEMDYLIRFQNTGTAEAYNIEIRDTLSEYLDITSVRSGASSHAYSFNLEGDNVVVFRFNDINLPDSTTNEAASHGFVQFRVKQRPNVPLNSVIYNQAAIYFDVNSPIITNQTFHTVGKDFLISTTESPDNQQITFFVHPNPARDFATFSLESKYALPSSMTLRLFSPTGVLVLESAMEGNVHTLNTQSLADGMWFYEVVGDGRSIGRGKFVKK